ncbi:MAG TPA: ferritin-like domain-containing protein, partial [Burkholderiales bacterium]|nr:ferritin-like domain-containing protein [Burkholderiales bacterium]
MREQLIHVLTEAAEIEHNLLCSYLYAAFSFKRGVDDGLTPLEAPVVERWRKLVLSVAIEEMGHLALVNNLLVAIGGSPHFNRPNFPVPPGYHPSGFTIRLTPFDRETLSHFLFLERPAGVPVPDGEKFVERAPAREPPPRRITP